MKPKTNPLVRNLLSAAIGMTAAANAAPYTWDSTTNNWDSSHWTPGPVAGPTASTDSAIINGGQVTINSLTIDSPIAINSGATVIANAEASVANVTLGGNLTGSGTLTKAGGWSLLLSGDNSGFSGTINADVSNILFTADSAGSAAADWVLSSGANVVNNMTGTGHTIKLGSLAGTGGTLGGGNASGAAATFEIGGNGKSTTFAGQIMDTPSGWGGGTASLTKVGSGTLTLSGANTYTGATAVNVGTLKIGDGGTSGTLGTGNVTIASGATLEINRSNYYGTGSGQVFSGDGTITKEGAGDLVFNGGVDHTNVQGIRTVVVNNGLVRTDNWGQWNSNLNLTVNGSGKFEMWNGNASLANLSGNGTVQNTKNWSRGAQTLTVAAGSFSGSITDLGITSGGAGTGDTRINLVKNTAGTLTLSGSNDYHGTTTVSGGKLVVNGDNSAATGAVTVASGATLGGAGTVGGATTIESGGHLAVGNSAGTQTFSSTLTFDSGSIFDWELNAGISDPGANTANSGTYDKVVANGNVTGTSAFTIALGTNAFTNAFWDTNKSWSDIFNGSGSFDLSTLFTTFGGTGVASNGLVTGQGQFSFTSNTLNWTAVPEPTSALAGLLITAGLLRRRRNVE